MHCTSPLSYHVGDGAVETIDGVRFLLDDDPARTVIARCPDGSTVRMPLGEFLQQRRLTAQALRQAEFTRCFASIARRIKLVRSSLTWRWRVALGSLGAQRKLH